jgi:predicted Fe-S protein YdhL (DUF1289 family)
MSRSFLSPLQTSVPEPVVPSPCINVCTMNPATGLCNGCYRTIEEIAAWASSTNAYKRSVLTAIEVRRGGSA